LIASVAGVVALGAFSVYQARELRQARNERDIAVTKFEAAEKRAQEEPAAEKAAFAERKAKILQEILTQSSADSSHLFEQVVALKESIEAERTNSPEAGMARVLSSPEMRKAMRHQMEVFLDPMIDRTYGAVFEKLHLNADQVAGLKDLLKRREMAEGEKKVSMFDPDMDVSKRKELAEQIKKEKEGYDDQIRQFLGNDGYWEFQAYDKTSGDRDTVDQMASQWEGSGTELNAAQREQLVQTLDDERGRFTWSIDIGELYSGTVDYSELTDERLNQYAKDREQFNAVILDRARQFLTPEQLASLAKSLAIQRQMLLYSLKMKVKRMK
jgi:hypothetical protein